ncbi:MAG: SDR family oxidoreductase [Chloroflexi bacterium]|nr:SDR family oxidoreductase [Chloroflexota bacterium]
MSDGSPARVAVVTGASRGIGRATALALARAGYRVGICARGADALAAVAAELTELGAGVEAAAIDVGDEAAVRELFGRVDRRWGRLDVLINNAAVLHLRAFADLDAATWDDVMATNVRGAFLCSREAFRLMPRNGGGQIVNLSSLSGLRGPEKFPGMSSYVVSKYAIMGLTDALAVEGKPLGIRVNAVTPGAVDTDMLRSTGTDLAPGVTPDDVAAIIMLLLDQAAKPISGANLEIFSNA